MFQQQDSSILTDIFYLLSNPYIKNISNLYNPDKKLILKSPTLCDPMFSDPELDHIFHVFRLHTWIIFFFFSGVDIFHLLRRREGVVI